MRTKLSVILPGIRKGHWSFFYDRLKMSLGCSFELIIVSPYDLPEDLRDREDIKFVKDFGSAARCQQIGLYHATGELVTWCADDCVFFKDRLGELVHFYELNRKSYRDIAIFKYFEGKCGANGLKHTSGKTEMSTWNYYRLKNACPWLAGSSIPGDYWILNSGILDTRYAKELGGWDAQFECTFAAHVDLAIRTQNDGARYMLFEQPLLHCTHTPGPSGDHGPVHYGQILHDEPLLREIYFNKASAGRTNISLENWKDSPEVWTRRFGTGIQ